MIRCATRTRTGRLHDENQDRLVAHPDSGTFLVVDGMGGLADAAATAQAVVDLLPRGACARAAASDGPDATRRVTEVLAELNERVRAGARTGPGTTGAAIALVLVRGGRALVAHLGDSRVYLARDGRVRRLTEDHASDGHLTRFVGMPGAVVPGVSVHELAAGDRVLLCTDGLTNSVDDHALGVLLTSAGGLESACARLVDAAARGGAVDDISVIAVEIGAGWSG
ncbi:PP2C family protein-serine/threonine phosphatase [Saccharothrix australiensis]|uniref:Protein phosphatase n=1 Tax=Saccharothrix australiensis TaxID=2072 RepID=A0A495W197_9PSEU|nr:protein phosphatase 2C domain-containing protein [Saccharothrix australiensis]RKT55174.1 protein phosphatase [Saccharothrix australiensis]